MTITFDNSYIKISLFRKIAEGFFPWYLVKKSFFFVGRFPYLSRTCWSKQATISIASHDLFKRQAIDVFPLKTYPHLSTKQTYFTFVNIVRNKSCNNTIVAPVSRNIMKISYYHGNFNTSLVISLGVRIHEKISFHL